MTKYKMIFYVDGDNNVGKALQGLSDLTPKDEVHVFYGSKNKHYTDQRKNELQTAGSAHLTFTEVESKADAADFAIAVEISNKRAQQTDKQSIYVLISMDQHFDTIAEQLIRIFGKESRVLRASSIEDVLANYFTVKAYSAVDLRNLLTKYLGSQVGAEIYKNLGEIFAEGQQEKRQAEGKPLKKRIRQCVGHLQLKMSIKRRKGR